MSFSAVGRVVFIIVYIACATSLAQDHPQLNFADQILLLDCHPVSTVPCFRTSFNVVNSNGEPYGIDLPSTDQLLSGVTITADGVPMKVFYASTGGTTKSVRGRLALVLVDISGSMARKLATSDTRFEAARAALTQFLGNFQDGVDEVAIVPFESHNVASTIRAASFAHTKNDALAQVNGLPEPQKRNNTALYSAVSLGVDVLTEHIHKQQANNNAYSPETMLIVMTDGTNDVERGDDEGLLGPEGLEQVARKVSAAPLQMIAIGFGEASEIDLGALERISPERHYMASDAERLKKVFEFTRKLLVDRIQFTGLSPWPDRASLEGRTITFKASLQLQGKLILNSNEAVFRTPHIGLPLVSGNADPDELAALNRQTKPMDTTWLTLLRPVFVFLGLGGILMIAWFWIPRLVWPGQYIGSLAFAKPAGRWASPTRASQRPPPGTPRNTPPGFEQGKAGSRQRTPQDATVVQPASEDSKIRLHRDFRR